MTINKNKIICHSQLVMVMIYFSQEALNIPSFLGQLLLLLILLISAAYIPKVMLNATYRTKFTWVWLIFIIHNSIYFLITASYSDYGLLKAALLNFLPFFPFYYFSVKGILTGEKLILFLFAMLPICIFILVKSMNEMIIDRGKEEVVDNAVYLFIGLMPLLYFIKNKLITSIIFILVLYFVIESNKKAAVICWLLAFFLYFFTDEASRKILDKIKNRLLSSCLAVGVIFVAYYLYLNNDFLIKRMEMMMGGYTSNRDTTIIDFFNAWYHSDSIVVYLFGFGFNSTPKFTPFGSHNDWMDMLGSFGLVGFLLYSFLFMMLVNYFFKKDWDKTKRVAFLLFLGIAFIVSMTSRWYFASFAYMNFLVLPYLLATRKEKFKL